jgi:YD repeat-containing protein
MVNSFPLTGPTNTVSRTRPYLTNWQDAQGNTWLLFYGTDSSAPDYGSIVRIECGNGGYLGLNYNAGGYVIAAYASGGQRTSYEYDDFGDLVRAVRPDASEEVYEYQHKQFTNNGTIYVDSTHLLIKQLKPDGRVLENVYDALRRVTVQKATVGSDLNTYTNATFTYWNNFTLSRMTNGITGYTLIADVNGNINRYDYTNSLVTIITDPLSQTVQQNWYADNATPPGFPRSPWQIKDKRGLWTQFQYDGNGNVTNTFSWGDLTGDGSTTYATNTLVYNTNNLPTQITDPIGLSVQLAYHPQYLFLPEYFISSAGGTPMSTNKSVYYNVTNTVLFGNATYTNIALGLLQRQIRAFGSPDAATNQWNHDGRGFLAQQVRYTATADPAVTNTFYCNDRGEVIERVDAAGRKSDFDYDSLGRPISLEVFESGQSQPFFWETAYYNGSGELT